MSGETQARRRKDKKKSRRDSVSDVSGDEEVKQHSEPAASCLTVLVFLILLTGIGVLAGLMYIQSTGVVHVPTPTPAPLSAEPPVVETLVETLVEEQPPADSQQQPQVEQVVQVVEEHIVYVDQNGEPLSAEPAAAAAAVPAAPEPEGIQLEGSESEPPPPPAAEQLQQLPDIQQQQQEVVVQEQEMRVRQVLKLVTAADGSITQEVISEVPLTSEELQEEAEASQAEQEAVAGDAVEENLSAAADQYAAPEVAMPAVDSVHAGDGQPAVQTRHGDHHHPVDSTPPAAHQPRQTQTYSEEPVDKVKPTEKPIEKVKPSEKPAEKVKPTEKPIEKVKPAEKPVEKVKPTEKPAQKVKPTEKPVEKVKPTEKPVEKVKPTEKPVEKVKPTEKPVEKVKPTEKPVEKVKPTEKPVEKVKPTEKPVEKVKPTEKPVEKVKPTEKPAAKVKPTEKPGEKVKPTKKPVEMVKPTEKPIEKVKPTEKPVEKVKPTEKPVEKVKPTEKPVEKVKPTEKPVEKVKPTEKLVEKVKPTEKPAEKVKPTEKPVEKVKPTEKPVEEVKPTEKPVQNLKPSKKSEEKAKLSEKSVPLEERIEEGSSRVEQQKKSAAVGAKGAADASASRDSLASESVANKHPQQQADLEAAAEIVPDVQEYSPEEQEEYHQDDQHYHMEEQDAPQELEDHQGEQAAYQEEQAHDQEEEHHHQDQGDHQEEQEYHQEEVQHHQQEEYHQEHEHPQEEHEYPHEEEFHHEQHETASPQTETAGALVDEAVHTQEDSQQGQTTDSAEQHPQEGPVPADQAYEHAEITSAEDWPIRDQLDAADALVDKEPLAARDAFSALLVARPRSPRALYGRARAMVAQANLERSNNALDKALGELKRLMSQDVVEPLPDRLFRDAAEFTVQQMRFRGLLDQAARIQQRLIQRYPDDYMLRNHLATVFMTFGQNSAAEEVLREVLRLWPDNGYAQVHLGFLMRLADKHEEAARLMQAGIDSDEPGVHSARFYYALADCYHRIGQHESSTKVKEEGVRRGLFLGMDQRSIYNVKHLTGRPIWTAEQSGSGDLIRELEESWEAIRDEMKKNVLESDKPEDGFHPESEHLRREGDWKQYFIFKQGQVNQYACATVPFTCALLKKYSQVTTNWRGSTKFSMLSPGAQVWPHCAPTNCRLRIHLGLIVPDGTGLRIGNQTTTWQEGKVMVLDDSFEHYVWNNSTAARIILIVDIWHPELTLEERRSIPSFIG